MKYLLLIYIDPNADNTPADRERIGNEYGVYTQMILDSGEFVNGDALQTSDTATCVRRRDGQVAMTDGPYVETKEYLGGYYTVDVKDLDRALELAALIPHAKTGAVEVRPVLRLG